MVREDMEPGLSPVAGWRNLGSRLEFRDKLGQPAFK